MPASTKETASIASILFASTLHGLLFQQLPFAATAIKYKDALYPGEYYYSQTLTHGSEFRPAIKRVADQIAAGIRASYPSGFQCVEYSYPALLDRFSYNSSAISRTQMFGIAVAATAAKVGEDRMQLTLLTQVIEWQPK